MPNSDKYESGSVKMKRKKMPLLIVILLIFAFVSISCNRLPFTIKTNLLANAEDSFEKIIDVPESLELEVRVQKGNIIIRRGEDRKVRINSKFRVYGTSKEKVEADAKAIKENPPIELKERKVIIGNLKRYNLDRWFSEENVTMDFEIYAPAKTSAYIVTGLGNVNVRSLAGSVKINTGLGSIEIENIAKVDAKSGSGDIKITGINEGVSVLTGKGNIELKNIQGNINAKTGFGNISIDSKIEDNKKWTMESGLGNIMIWLSSDDTFSFSLVIGTGNIGIEDFEAEFSYKTERKLEGKIGTNPTASITARIGKGNILIKKQEVQTKIKI